MIERFEEPEGQPRPGKKPLTRINAAIYCERTGQKAILIGKGGSKLKEIGTGARRKIESLLGTRVYLELYVIVEPGWRESRAFVETLDWRNQLERLAETQAGRKLRRSPENTIPPFSSVVFPVSESRPGAPSVLLNQALRPHCSSRRCPASWSRSQQGLDVVPVWSRSVGPRAAYLGSW